MHEVLSASSHQKQTHESQGSWKEVLCSPRGHRFLLYVNQSLSWHAWFTAQGVLSCDEWAPLNLAVIMRVAGPLNPFELVIAAGLNNEH